MVERQIARLLGEYKEKTKQALIVIGARRVGKTSILQSMMEKGDLYFDFENQAERELFQPSVPILENILGCEPKTVIFDEIQYLEQAGAIIKLIHDHLPHITLLASGSASFLMMQNLGDSALGRKFTFMMYPLTIREILGCIDLSYEGLGTDVLYRDKAMITAMLDNILVYGSLPQVYFQEETSIKQAILKEYVASLLFKDIFGIEGIRNSKKITKLAQLLAYQVGSLINPNELAGQLEMSRNTVLHYIDLLEKFSIISVVQSFSNNPRKEINKQFKVYFSDVGIMNALVNDFRPLSIRNPDMVGRLFENFVYTTFQAQRDYFATGETISFWRDRNGYEVDFVFTRTLDEKIIPVEVKYGKEERLTRAFSNLYADKMGEYHCVTRENFWRYV